MKYGMSTWFFQENNVTEALIKIKKIGFSVGEIWMEHLLRTGENLSDVKETADNLGLSLTVHATSYDINITSMNRGIRAESEKQAYDAVSTGALLGADIVVIHPGRLSASRSSITECRESLISALIKIDQWAYDENIIVGLEAMEKRSREIFIYPKDVIDIMSIGWKKIRLTFDIAHSYTVMEPTDYLKKINPDWIGQVHLSDGNSTNTHLPLGEGEINIVKTLKKLEEVYSGNVVIEGYIPGKGLETAALNYKYLSEKGLI